MPAEPYPHYLPELWAEMKGLADSCFWTPARLHRFFLLMVRGHWSDKQNQHPALLPDLGCLEWDPDPKLSKLGIEIFGKTLENAGPNAIWVKLGNFRFETSGIGNISGVAEDNATVFRTIKGNCQLLVAHESPDLLVSYEMAFSTLCFLLGMTESILDAMGGEGQQFQPELLGDPARVKEDPKGIFRVDVGCRLDITLGVATAEESHRLAIVANLPQVL
jgi:hypothetical protein